jgi:hypothetical protein
VLVLVLVFGFVLVPVLVFGFVLVLVVAFRFRSSRRAVSLSLTGAICQVEGRVSAMS